MEAMIIIRADFNRLDARGRLRLGGLAMHDQTPFAEIAERSGSILFIDGEDAVQGRLVLVPDEGWLGEVDWATQQLIESWPPVTAGAH